jgi:hypothetical protein
MPDALDKLDSRIKDTLTALLDEREAAAARRADPKARSDSLATRLEAMLDDYEATKATRADKAKKPRVVKNDDDEDGGLIGALFGG